MLSPLSGKDTLDKTILACLKYDIATFIPPKDFIIRPRSEKLVKVGRFVFDAFPHATGCDVHIWILGDEGDCFEIVNTTYWYSSSYTCNKSTWIYGSWDEALGEVIFNLKTKVAEEEEKAQKVRDLKWTEAEEKFYTKKAKFEKFFQ